MGEALSNYAAIFDGDVIALPTFSTEPTIEAELPRIVLRSGDESWELQAAPARISITWKHGTQLDGEKIMHPLDQCNIILKHLIQTLNLTVGRVAFLINRTASDETADRDLVEHFTNDWAKGGPISRSDAFEIHNLKRYQLPHLKRNVNSWMRCKTSFAINDEKSGVSPFIFVEQDLNTWPEESNTFSSSDVSNFFVAALEETQSILLQYFPQKA
jgi:hypothetical protein